MADRLEGRLEQEAGSDKGKITADEMDLVIKANCANDEVWFSLVGAFGKGIIKFIDLFSGKRIVVPTRRSVYNSMRMARCFLEIKNNDYSEDSYIKVAEVNNIDIDKLRVVVSNFKDMYEDILIERSAIGTDRVVDRDVGKIGSDLDKIHTMCGKLHKELCMSSDTEGIVEILETEKKQAESALSEIKEMISRYK